MGTSRSESSGSTYGVAESRQTEVLPGDECEYRSPVLVFAYVLAPHASQTTRTR